MTIKSELIMRIAEKQKNIPETDIAHSINFVLEKMTKQLANGGRIEIRDFGSFDLRYHKERVAHNPKTGNRIVTQAKNVVHFKPGKAMKERINQSSATEIKKV